MTSGLVAFLEDLVELVRRAGSRRNRRMGPFRATACFARVTSFANSARGHPGPRRPPTPPTRGAPGR
ncbi:MAG: hypothetical protein WKG07_13010 [Hymenobacter sp.]